MEKKNTQKKTEEPQKTEKVQDEVVEETQEKDPKVDKVDVYRGALYHRTYDKERHGKDFYKRAKEYAERKGYTLR